MTIKEVFTNEIDGIKCIMLTDETGEKWVNLEPIGKECGLKHPAKSINKIYNNHLEEFRSKALFHPIGEKGRPRLFFNNEGVTLVKLLSRKFKKHPKRLEELAKFLSQIDDGTLKVAHKDDIKKFKEAQQKTHHLILGQDLTFILKRLDRIENLIIQQNGAKALPDASTQDSGLMDLDRKKIIAWLFDRVVEEQGIPFFEIWWKFCEEIGIKNNSYAKQHKNLFPKMLMFFFSRDRRLVVRSYNWYNSQSEPDEDIKDILLSIFQKSQQKKIIDIDDTNVIT